jgi:hypothetical protein
MKKAILSHIANPQPQMAQEDSKIKETSQKLQNNFFRLKLQIEE